MKKTSLLTVCCFLIYVAFAQRGYTHLINQKAPPVNFQSALDKTPSPGFYKNKILVLDFWATWCAPCIASFPHINQLAQKMEKENIVFAAITDEPEQTVKAFFKRTGKVLKPYKLIDTAKQTIRAFGIEAIPVTLVIDKNNTIIWAGLTSELTEDILQKAVKGGIGMMASSIEEKKMLRNRPIAQRAAFSFSAAVADSTKDNYEDLGLTYRIKDRIIMLSEGNIRLDDFLESLLGYSKAARFITNDTGKLKKRIDVFFKADGDSTLFSDYRNLIVPNDPRKNLLLTLLGQTFKFSLGLTKRKQAILELIIVDTGKLASFMSLQQERQSFSTDYLPRVEAVGYSLSQIATALENLLKTAVISTSADPRRLDLSLDITNRETLRKSLLFHGLDFKETEKELEFVNITFR
jgi:thiol-disulfide isomerase/thioredoxin